MRTPKTRFWGGPVLRTEIIFGGGTGSGGSEILVLKVAKYSLVGFGVLKRSFFGSQKAKIWVLYTVRDTAEV